MVGVPVVTAGISLLKSLIKLLTLSTTSLELEPEYQPPSPLIPHSAARLVAESIGRIALKFSSCVLARSKEAISLKDLPKPTTAVLIF